MPLSVVKTSMKMRHLFHGTFWAAFAVLATLDAAAQGVFAVPGSPGWTQQLVRESNEGPQLKLIVRPLIEGAVVRKGFSIRVHQDNTLWTSLQRNGRKPYAFDLPPGHLYTLEVSNEAAYKKVIQIDTKTMNRPLRLDCDIDLMLRPSMEPLSFEDNLILDMPLSVVWFDSKRNLFRHDAYLHTDGINQLRSHLSLRDPSTQPAP